MIGIYCFRNKINGKCYIGQSIHLEKRYNEHKNNHLNPKYCNYNSKFYRALRKYGFENFEYIILATCQQCDLNALERFYIHKYDSKNYRYNSTDGGEDNPSLNPEIVKKRNQTISSNPKIIKKLSHKGENNGNAKLTSQDVYFIREEYKKGKSFNQVYQLFKHRISHSGFQQVWLGKTWIDIHMDVYQKGTPKNKGGSALNDKDIIDIRTRYEKYHEDKNAIYEDYKEKIGKVGFNKILRHDTWKNIIV